MGWLDRLTIKSRLLLMLIAVSLLSVVVIGLLGWLSGQRALDGAIREQMTGIRESKAQQVEIYFDDLFGQARTLASDRMVVNSFRELSVAFDEALERPISAQEQLALTEYYDDVFLPELDRFTEESAVLPLYRPRRAASNYFQHHFIINNPFPLGDKDKLTVAEGDTTTYSRFHEIYQPIFSDFITEFGYYDLFLIDIDSGDVVYSVEKEVDFATSMTTGPYSESGLGILTKRIAAAPERDSVEVVDFRPYDPSYAAPAAFIGAPIFDGNEAVGVLALQLPVDEINRVMTGDQGWTEAGLGDTGEVYLVGPDKMMRSASRSMVEDPDGYLDTVGSLGLSSMELDRIGSFGTTIGFQPVRTASVDRAQAGQVGTEVIDGYLGERVLSAYRKVDIGGLDWVILAEIEDVEAFTPVRDLQLRILLWGVGLVLVVAFLAIILSKFFVRPVELLSASVKRLADGDDEVQIDLQGRGDEFGALADSFNSMVVDLRAQRETIEEKNQENERLLLSILPASLASRLEAGEHVADNMPRVSVVFVHLFGFSEISHASDPARASALLADLVELLDAQGHRFGLERVKIVGETYVAACGFTDPYSDHARRAIDFALACVHAVEQHDTSLALAAKVGIDSGPVVSSIVGSERIQFELWGRPVNRASELYQLAEANEILVTDDTLRAANGSCAFGPARLVDLCGDNVEVAPAQSARQPVDADSAIDLTVSEQPS